ncbi:MAG: SIR2 family protein [Anaerolineales bacterium]|nr:SIR2 family protein [Anaerolineales bacterium]
MSFSKEEVKLAASLKKGNLVVLTGAGISHSWPSGLPLAGQISSALVSLLVNQAHLSNDLSFVQLKIEKLIAKIPMELLWESLAEGVGEKVLEALKVLDTDQPNMDHFAIVAAYKKLDLVIATLNFDLLHEKAIKDLRHVKANSVSSAEEFETFLRGHRTRPHVLHIHGSFSSFDTLVSTVGSVGMGLASHKKQALMTLFESHDILCAGYSDNDSDLLPLLGKLQKQLFWYQFSGDLPKGIKYVQRKLGDRFILVKRSANEATFAEKLARLDPSIRSQLQKVKFKEVKNIQQTDVWTERASRIAGSVYKNFPSSAKGRVAMSRFVLAKLFDEIGEREYALKLLSAAKGVGWRNSQFQYRSYMRGGHALERLGDKNSLISAVKSYSEAKRINASSKMKLDAELALSSAQLGLWKRYPWRLIDLLQWSHSARKLLYTRHSALKQRAYWEFGDWYHFLGEYLVVPSAVLARLFKIELSGEGNLLRLLSVIDKAVLFLLMPIRRELLKRAFFFYASGVRLGFRTLKDDVPAFTALGIVRMVEVLAALGRIQQAAFFAKNFVSRSHALFSWAKSSHGNGVTVCSEGVRLFYAGKLSTSVAKLKRARTLFGTHGSGIVKVDVFLYRVKYWT